MPEITPYETGEGKYQVEADYGSVKLPVLLVYRAGAGFEDVGEDSGQDEACRQFDEVITSCSRPYLAPLPTYLLNKQE